MLKLAVAIFLCALVRPGSCDQGNDDQKMDVFRLPTETKPQSYELKFIPKFNGNNSTFSGETKINITVHAHTNVITLNLKDLNVTKVTVADITNAKARNISVNNFINIIKNEQLKINLYNFLIAGRKYQVTISYEGKIRNDMSGLYMSSYQEGNTIKWMAVTQFEATSARKAFPCYDEPSYKATFNISVVKQKNQIALSNMPISSIQNGTSNTDVVYFEVTPLMSTYLAALYVGDFVPNKYNSTITVYTQPQYSNQTFYVSNDAPKHLSVLEEYTGINYMLQKMDLLAIPDFKAGAMENWGMNTYQEYYMLLHEDTKAKLKIRSSEVVQHEFTHQWFGNLVTCAWWDSLWLNEGFARYFQYFATKLVKTNWPLEELFVVETHQGALKCDQTQKHPITSSVNTPEEIDNIFDHISYSKAASVIRMLTHLITENMFKLSLHKYLISNSYAAVTPETLYNAIDNTLYDEEHELENGLTISEFMTNWTTQSGYPIVSITKNETSNTFSLIQNRFFINATEKNNNDTSIWLIGLTYTTQERKNFTYTKPTIWTNKISNLTVIEVPKYMSKESWYIFNIQSTGFYRVNYDTKNWMKLINQLNSTPTDIHVLNRAQLIDDAFALARAGYLDYSVPLNMSKYLKKEKSIIPWYTAMNNFNYLIQRMPRDEQGYNNFKAHVSNLAGTIFKQLDDSVSKNNREFSVLSAWDTFASWACRLENKYCMKKALEYFKKWQNGEKILADIKDAAFCIGVKNSNGSSTFNNMFDLYKTTKSISEKLSVESALGCSANRTQLEEYINHILDGPQGPIKAKDYKSVISSISRTPLGLDVLCDFLSRNINITLNQLPNGEDIVTHIYSIIANKLTNDKEIEKIKKLKDSTTTPISVRKSFEKSYEDVKHNLLWFNTYSNGISQWALDNFEKEEPVTTEIAVTTTKYSTTTTNKPIIIETSTIKTSSATSNVQNTFMIILFTISTVLFTIRIL